MATKLQELLEELKLDIIRMDNPTLGLNQYNRGFNECKTRVCRRIDNLITKYTETTPTYKPGDNVRVLRNMFGHPFTLSEPIILTMTIDDPIEGIWSAIQEVGSLRGNITEAEFEPIN